MEEVTHCFLAGRANDLVLFINQNQGEWAWFVDITPIFGSVLSETVTLLAHCDGKALHIILQVEGEVCGTVLLVADITHSEVLSDRYANAGLTEMGEVIIDCNCENTVISFLDTELFAERIRPQVRVVSPITSPFTFAPWVSQL